MQKEKSVVKWLKQPFYNTYTGADEQDRTADLILTKDVLCLLSYISGWQGQKDLNPRHAVLETAALPTELYP